MIGRLLVKITSILRRRKCQHTRFADEDKCWVCGENQQGGWL